MATRDSVLALAKLLTAPFVPIPSVDDTELLRLWDELILELGNDPRGWFTACAFTDTGTTGDASAFAYELRTSLNVAKILALFFGGRQLARTTQAELIARDPEWQDRIGTPIAFLDYEQPDRYFQLYPRPDRASTAGDKPGNQIFVVYTLSHVLSVPDTMELPLALLILAREFQRESMHRDQTFADACKQLGMALLDVVS